MVQNPTTSFAGDVRATGSIIAAFRQGSLSTAHRPIAISNGPKGGYRPCTDEPLDGLRDGSDRKLGRLRSVLGVDDELAVCFPQAKTGRRVATPDEAVAELD